MRHLILSSQIQVLVTNSTVAIPAHLNDFRSLLPVLFACILSLYNSLSRRQTPNQIMIHPCWTLQKCFVVFRIILKFFTKFSTMHIMHSFLPLNLISYHYHIHYTQISLIFFLYFNWINSFLSRRHVLNVICLNHSLLLHRAQHYYPLREESPEGRVPSSHCPFKFFSAPNLQ